MNSLQRSMGSIEALLITLSNITPCCAVFVLAPVVLRLAGTGALLSFVGAAAIACCMALIYAELASAFPVAGGEYAIVGRILGPFAGFLTLGVNLVTSPLALAGGALSIGSYLRPLIPNVSPLGAALSLVAVSTGLAVLNIRTNSIITGVFLCIELLALATLCCLGFGSPRQHAWDLLVHPSRLSAYGNLEPASIGVIALAIPVALMCYNGYGQAVYLSEETTNARRSIARVILYALLVTVIAEAIPVAAVLCGAPDVTKLLSSPQVLSDFVRGNGGEALVTAISVGVSLAQLNASIALTLMYSRQVFSTGRDQVWPRYVNNRLIRIHCGFRSPWVSTVLCGALSSAACFISFNVLVVVSGSGLIFTYVVLCVAVIVGRYSGATSHGKYRMPFYPLPPIAAMAGLCYVVFATYQDADVGRPSLWVTGVMIIMSIAYYFLLLRRRGEWVLSGPADESRLASAGAPTAICGEGRHQ